MARYIDADAAVEEARLAYCKECNSYNGIKCRACPFDDAMSFIEDYPAADVVPNAGVEMLKKIILTNVEATEFEVKEAKARLAREIIGIIDKRMEQKTEQCIGVRNEIVLGVYRGQLDAYRDVKEIIEQKYTEEQT